MIKIYKRIGSDFIQVYGTTWCNQFFHAALKAYYSAAEVTIIASKHADNETECRNLHAEGKKLLLKVEDLKAESRKPKYDKWKEFMSDFNKQE